MLWRTAALALGLLLSAPAYADFYSPPPGTSSTPTPGASSWVDPTISNSASGLNTTGPASITSPTTALTLANPLNLVNGMAIGITGVGPAGAILNTTVASGGGTLNIVVGNASSTTNTSATVYEIGTIGSTSKVLTLATTAGWLVNEGIDIATVGLAGADLITTVTAVSPTQLTLAAATTSAGTNVKINHDDTAAIAAALATTKNVSLPFGQFNLTSTLTIAFPQWVQCATAAPGTVVGFTGNGGPQAGTMLNWRTTTGWMINITSQQASLKDCGGQQAADITPSAGGALQIGSGGSTLLDGGNIERNFFYNFWSLLNINQGVIGWNASYNNFYGGPLTGATIATINNPAPAGDIKWHGNAFINESADTFPAVKFTASDTDIWTNNKFDNCAACISSSSATANNQSFVGNSFENIGTGGAVVISAGAAWMFTGNQFGVDNGNGGFVLSGNVNNVTVVGNILTNSFSGAPYATTSSGVNQVYCGNIDGSGSQCDFPGAVISGGVNVSPNYFAIPILISALPTCPGSVVGNIYTVSNGTATPTYHQAVSATGAATWPVFCSTAGWVYM